MVENVIIMGAAGRDFHNFNVYFRDNKRYHVVCFTATQIPDIDGRQYPPEIAGSMYPHGIPIESDENLMDLIKANKVDLVAFSYSDIPHTEVMHKASQVTAAGADFIIIGAQYTMLESSKKVVSVCAIRTGCGKSQTSRQILQVLRDAGKKVVTVRHPMPYGDLTRQVVQRFASYEDFEKHACTIEEREEYEPVVAMGAVIYAGVDYGKILRRAEKEADVVVWDGGNNDTPFYKPDVNVVVFDPHRVGHETTFHPGETNLLLADIAVINKVDSADPKDVETPIDLTRLTRGFAIYSLKRCVGSVHGDRHRQDHRICRLVLPSGQMVVLKGDSGSGKKHPAVAAGRAGPTPGGELTVAGHDLNHCSEADLTDFRRNVVGMIFQAFNLLPTLTVLENVCLPACWPVVPIKRSGRKRGNCSTGSALGIASATSRASSPVEKCSVPPLPGP
jgi:energy-coupling factor transporter ATP-binding protein EcfA2